MFMLFLNYKKITDYIKRKNVQCMTYFLEFKSIIILLIQHKKVLEAINGLVKCNAA